MADDDLTTKRGITVPARALSWWADRSGGPGGQHANTSDTAVTIELDLDEAGLAAGTAARLRAVHGDRPRATSADSRSQFRNRTMARKRMAELIDDAATPPPPRRRTRPTRGAKRRRLDAKRQQAEKKRRRAWRPGDD